MTTQIIEASQGLVTNEMQICAEFEICSEELIRKGVSKGEIVVLKNSQRKCSDPLVAGNGVSVKTCITFDISKEASELLDMLKIIKLTGGNCLLEKGACEKIAEKREKLMLSTSLPYGTLPIYQSVFENYEKNKNISKLTKKKILADVEAQASAGVDFVILDPSLTLEILAQAKENGNQVFSDTAKLVSFWMEAGDRENPYYEAFDEILDILRTYDVALCLELSLKNSSVCDFMNKNQIRELILIGELVEKARNSGVQVFVDALSAISLNNIEYAVQTIKTLTKNAPLFAMSAGALTSFDEQNAMGKSIFSAFSAYFGADIIQTPEIPRTAGYYNAKQLKESIEATLTIAKSVDYARGREKAVKFEEEYLSNCKQNDSVNSADFIKNLFS